MVAYASHADNGRSMDDNLCFPKMFAQTLLIHNIGFYRADIRMRHERSKADRLAFERTINEHHSILSRKALSKTRPNEARSAGDHNTPITNLRLESQYRF